MARDQTQPGSFSRERKEPGNEVDFYEKEIDVSDTILDKYSSRG